jgi:uncharacterized membrane protein YeiH
VDPLVVADDVTRLGLELAGVLVFALSGGLMAVRKGFDVVGILVLALLTSLGGGMLRDVLIGDIPPAALRDTRFLAVPFAATVLVFLAHRLLERIERAVLVFDAAGMALFAVVGTLKASAAGLGPLQATVLGTITAVGGGLLRDVVARETPVLLRADSTLYSVPAFAGAAVIAGLAEADVAEPAIGLLVVAAVFAWRVAAMRFGWRAPTALGAPRRGRGAAGHP